MVTQEGVRYAAVDGVLHEVVVATAGDVQNLPASSGAQTGVYVVGTGNTGAARTFQVLGLTYLGAMLAGAMGQRVPHPDWKPDGWSPPSDDAGLVSTHNVHYNQALKTPQFALFWLAVAGNAIAGVTIMSCAKTIMSDVFGSVLPAIVSGGFAAGTIYSPFFATNSTMVARVCMCAVAVTAPYALPAILTPYHCRGNGNTQQQPYRLHDHSRLAVDCLLQAGLVATCLVA